MNEPNWAALPWPTDASTWKAFLAAPDARERVWVERDACFDFAERIDRDVMTAFAFIGNGVVRWVAAKLEEEGEPLDGKTFSVEFGGAPDRKYMVTCDGDNYLVHLVPSYYLDRPDKNKGQGQGQGNGRECPPAPDKRLRRPVEPWPRSRRNIRGVGQPDGLPLKKWML